MDFSDVISVVKNDGSISYQNQVASDYWYALLHEGIVGRIPYVYVVALVAIIVFFIGACIKCRDEKVSILLLDLWIILVGIAYVLLMYYLYLTAFGEIEAVNLASYDRYMNSYLIAAVMLGIAILFSVAKQRILRFIVLLTMFFWLIIPVTNSYYIRQMMPGYVTGDIDSVEEYSKYVDTILQNTPAEVETKVYMVTCGDTGNIGIHINYYANPRTIEWGSVGPKRYEGDIWSVNYDVENFVNKVSEYEYLYLLDIDDCFVEAYNDAFVYTEDMYEGNMMKIQLNDGKICCEE